MLKRESGNLVYPIDSIYVSRLKKNLVSVWTLENKVYEVIFGKVEDLLKSLNCEATKRIGVRMKQGE